MCLCAMAAMTAMTAIAAMHHRLRLIFGPVVTRRADPAQAAGR